MQGANSQGCRDLVAGFVDAGVTRVIVSPGSRNTPLTLAFSSAPDVIDVSIRDERSAAFAALGWAKATGRPAVALCTSGSAATHYLPAVVEADQAAIPLILLTADRPTSLRGTSAPQTMDQTNLYGTHVKAFIDLDIEHQGVRETGAAVVASTLSGIPGPVHVNVPLSEPLTPTELTPASSPLPVSARTQGRAASTSVRGKLEGKKVLIVAGGTQSDGYARTLGAYAGAMGAPLIADPQCRPDAPATIANADLLASVGTLDRLIPDVVLRLGGIPTSKSVWTWLEGGSTDQILVNRSRLADPLSSANTVIDVSPQDFVADPPEFAAAHGFLEAWRSADTTVGAAVTDVVGDAVMSEPFVAMAVVAGVESGSIVFVGSSMPIRDVDTFAAPRGDVRVIANRGVNGIDGSISTAIGCALSGVPTTALIGDISALHDVAALSEAMKLGVPLRVVVINNDGGGIFSFLPQKRSSVVPDDVYERHWGTPHGLSLTAIASSMNVPAQTVDQVTDLNDLLSEPTTTSVIEVLTDRTANAALHRDVRRAAAASLVST